jgi:branched-chain amino acid transport system ATP-binding protein
MSGMLEIDNVYTAYDKADVLQGVSLAVKPGSITCLLGSNGSGKTTLVRSILGLTAARAGRIMFDGIDITHFQTHKIIAAGIACIPEGRKVFPKLTVEENLRVGAYQERSDKVTQARMAEIYEIFPRLSERRTQLAGTMSGGEQAMVSIGRVEQNVHQTLAISHFGFVLSKGRVATSGSSSELANRPEVREAYFG